MKHTVKTLSLRLPPGLRAAAGRKAAAQGRSFSGYIRRLVRRDLEMARNRSKTLKSHA